MTIVVRIEAPSTFLTFVRTSFVTLAPAPPNGGGVKKVKIPRIPEMKIIKKK